MKNKVIYIIGMMVIVVGTYSLVLLSQPSFNGTTPGCGGGSCHTYTAGKDSITSINNLSVSVKVKGVANGEVVAGELVDHNGVVIAFNNGTTSNPFTLTASQAGTYTINAGAKKPSRIWDSVSVNLGVTGIETGDKHALPRQMQLYQNYPNPFNPETEIKFYLPERSDADLAVYNINGRRIRYLLNDNLESGVHSVKWNGRDDQGMISPSGVYLVQLKASRQIYSRRMLLVK